MIPFCMENPLKMEFDWYLAHQAEMVEKYNGKFIVIKNGAVIGIYDDQGQALIASQAKEKLGTFLIQKVEPGTSAYTQTFHSRVAFS